MPDRPKFLENALQGLAFWIGHRHAFFRHYPLTEGALVGEMCNLIQANLSDSLILVPECQYSRLVPIDIKIDGMSQLSPSDLVILAKDASDNRDDGPLYPFVHFVIEVKRGLATKSEIDNDLKRLATFLKVTETNARGFLIVVALF